MKSLTFKPLFTKENSSFWLRTDMKFARTKTSEVFDRAAKNVNTRFIKKILKVLPSNCFIAGGAAKDVYTNNTENINDIDIYSPSEEDAVKAYEALKTIKGEAIKQSNMAVSVRIKEDLPIASLIKICYFDNMEHCLDSFDFTICQFALGTEESICNPMGLIDHLNKKLNVHVLQPQTDCLYRLVKYVKKGYTPTNDALDKMHDFLSGNRTPVRAERPPTYGAEAIDNAINAIRPAIAGVVAPAPVAYAQPAPRMSLRNNGRAVVADNGREDGYGRLMNRNADIVDSMAYSVGAMAQDVIDTEYRVSYEIPANPTTWIAPQSGGVTWAPIHTENDPSIPAPAPTPVLTRATGVSDSEINQIISDVQSHLRQAVRRDPVVPGALEPSDNTIIIGSTGPTDTEMERSVNRLRQAIEDGSYSAAPAATGAMDRLAQSPRMTTPPRRGRNGLIRSSNGGNRNGDTL